MTKFHVDAKKVVKIKGVNVLNQMEYVIMIVDALDVKILIL